MTTPEANIEIVPAADLEEALQRVEQDEIPRPYTAAPEYYLAVAEALRSTPLTLRITDNSGRSSIVMGRIRKERQRGRIGYLSVPLPSLLTYTVIYRGITGSCDARSLVESLIPWLRQTYRVEQVLFTKQVTGSAIDQALAETPHNTALAPEAHWRLTLPESYEALMSRHSGKHRQRLRWERRKLEEYAPQPLTHEVLGTVDEIDSILTICESIGQGTYHARVGGMVRRDQVWHAVCRTLANTDSLACHLFRADHQAIAFVLTARHCAVVHIIAMAHLPKYNRYSLGKHLLLEVLRDSCDRGLRWVDYGFGDAQYKQVYGTHNAQERTHLLSMPTWRAAGVRHAIAAADATHNALQRAFGNRFANRVKRVWRTRLSTKAAHNTEQP